VDRLPDRDRSVRTVRDRDRPLVGLELAPLAAVPVALVRVVGLVRVEVDHVRAGVGEPPRAGVVLADHDERHPREGDPAHGEVVGPEVQLVPHRRRREREVGVVGDQRPAARGVLARDDPAVRADAAGALERREPLVEIGARELAAGGDGSAVESVAPGTVTDDGRVVIESEGVQLGGRLGAQLRRDQFAFERPEAPGQRPRDLGLHEHRVGGRPRVGLVVEQAELDREFLALDVGVHPLGERLDGPARLGARQQFEVGRRAAREVHRDVELVGVEGGLPHYLRQTPGHHSPLEVHLEEPVGGLRVADREVQRPLAVGGHVRGAVLVVLDLGCAVGALDPPVGPVGRLAPRPSGERREPVEIPPDGCQRPAGGRTPDDGGQQRAPRGVGVHTRLLAGGA